MENRAARTIKIPLNLRINQYQFDEKGITSHPSPPGSLRLTAPIGCTRDDWTDVWAVCIADVIPPNYNVRILLYTG